MRSSGSARTGRSLSLRSVPWLAAALLLAGCPPPEPPTPEQLNRQRLVETPCDTPEFEQMAEEFAMDTTAQVAVSARDLPNSTVHDCQRLVTNKHQLGPRVALLVSQSAVERQNFRSGVVVSDVVNYDNERYAALNVRPGLNCLWIRETPAAPSGWVAAVRQPPAGEDCLTATFDTLPGEPLKIVARTYEGSHEGDRPYPSTGRWMWDEKLGQLIGVRCGMAWCEISAGQGRDPAPYAHRDSIPGWSDEQYLSYMSDGVLQRSAVFGRIEPGKDLDTISKRTLPDDTIRGHAATVILSGGDLAMRTAYQTKLGLDPGADRHEVQYEGTSTSHRAHYRYGTAVIPLWKSSHTHAGPGAVRWAWSEKDEGLWFSCDEGCCKGSQAD